MTHDKATTHYRACNLCEATCGIAIEVRDGAIVSIRGDREDPITGYLRASAVYCYTLYVIHFPLLLLAFSLLHPWLHELHWWTVIVTEGGLFLIVTRVARHAAQLLEDRRLWTRTADRVAQRVVSSRETV